MARGKISPYEFGGFPVVCGNLRNVFFELIFMFLKRMGHRIRYLRKKIWRKKGGMIHPSVTYTFNPY